MNLSAVALRHCDSPKCEVTRVGADSVSRVATFEGANVCLQVYVYRVEHRSCFSAVGLVQSGWRLLLSAGTPSLPWVSPTRSCWFDGGFSPVSEIASVRVVAGSHPPRQPLGGEGTCEGRSLPRSLTRRPNRGTAPSQQEGPITRYHPYPRHNRHI